MLYGASSDNPDDWGSQRRGIVDFDPEASGPVYKHPDDWGKFIGNEFQHEGRGSRRQLFSLLLFSLPKK